jgi:tetratricopeptide (TPR) repeat protein
VWLFLLAILGGTAITQVPLEIGRWQLAKAIKLRAADDKEGAYRELAAAMERFPRSPELWLRRGEWKLEDGEEEQALKDFDKAVELAPEKADALEKRGNVLLKAGKFERAVEDWKQVERDSRRSGSPPRDVALNQLAYSQALAKVELDEALDNINRALDIRPNEPAFLDTRGYIYYLKDEFEPALQDLDKAVQSTDAFVAKISKPPAEGAKAAGKNSSGREGTTETRRRELLNASAVIHYHRALVLKALDRDEDAEKDLAVARGVTGREPDETLF